MKALSGFGESYESNIIMAKLAEGIERPKYSMSSATDSSGDSDKDVDSTERQRHRNRKPRKSPRSAGEKKKSSKHGLVRRVEFSEGLSELHEGGLSSLNQNNSSLSQSPILTHPKLHTHRRIRSRDLQTSGDSLVDFPGKNNLSPSPGGTTASPSAGETATSSSPIPIPVNVPVSKSHSHSHSLSHYREGGPLKLQESPLAGSGRDREREKDKERERERERERASSTTSESRERSQLKESPNASNESRSKATVSENVNGAFGKEANATKKVSPPVSSVKQPSPTHSGSREKDLPSLPQPHVDMGNTTKASSGGSANISPSCGSEGEPKVRVSPKSSKEPLLQSKFPSPPSGSAAKALMDNNQQQQSEIFSETFTVDKAHSFLESVSAIAENALAPRFVGSGAPHHDKGHRMYLIGGRGHRRTRSKDYQLQAEKSKSTPELTNIEATRRLSSETEQDSLSAGSDGSGKIRGHRRKRSKDLNQEAAEFKKDETSEGNLEEKREDSKSDHRRLIEANPLKPEDNGGGSSVSSSSRVTKEASPSQTSRPVLDGRRRHSSGSRPNSPIVVGGDRNAGEEKVRMSVAEQMDQRYKSLKSSSLNSLSGRSEDGSRQDIDKRTPSSESLPATSYKGDAITSKRTPSNESLLSGSSSRGEGSKRTQSTDSLMSIRTDTSKRSQSNESLPGSARTDQSRRSPSNESLPESIREESETDMQEEHKRSNPLQSCRRSQSMGSARDMARSVASRESASSSSSAPRSTSSGLSKFLLKLESITRNNSSSVKETKKSLMKRSKKDEREQSSGSKPPSDDERRSGRRSRNLSESDAEGGTSDPGSQLPPRAPSESSSGSHSDDNRHSRRGHQRWVLMKNVQCVFKKSNFFV